MLLSDKSLALHTKERRMRMGKFGFVVFGAAGAAIFSGSNAQAVGYLNETAWQAAAGAWMFDDFESWPAGAQLAVDPILDVQFDFLNDSISHPSVQDRANTGGPTDLPGTHVFLNDIDFALPDRGPYSMRPMAGDVITAVGMFNVGGDDTV